MHYQALTSLPGTVAPERGDSHIFSRELRSFTILATVGYSCHIFTYYYILKWLPTLIVEMGFSAAAAASVLQWMNVGGLIGAISFGLLAKRLGLRSLTVLLMLASSATVAIFGLAPRDLRELSLVCGSAGFTITAAVVGLYGLCARGFPTRARASGTGFCLGVGRGGSVIAPIMAGFLLRGGEGISMVSAIMASGSLLAAVAITVLVLPAARNA
jgi:MFS transporter, AAHS family, vanillate permease